MVGSVFFDLPSWYACERYFVIFIVRLKQATAMDGFQLMGDGRLPGKFLAVLIHEDHLAVTDDKMYRVVLSLECVPSENIAMGSIHCRRIVS